MESRRDEEKEGPLGHTFCVSLSHIAIFVFFDARELLLRIKGLYAWRG